MNTIDLVLEAKLVVIYALRAYYYLIIINILMSWVRPDPNNPLVRFIHRLTDPALMTARRFLPFLQAGMIDFSPIAVILLLELLVQLVSKLFDQLAISLS